MFKKHISIILIVLYFVNISYAQDKLSIKGKVIDSKEKTPIEYVFVFITSDNGKKFSTATDEHGNFIFKGITKGKYKFISSFVGYDDYKIDINCTKDIYLNIKMKSNVSNLQGVIVTGIESKKITSSTTINKDAMEYLQPSSFNDIVSLLPGGKAVNPDLSSANTVKLRETGNTSSDYNTSSLGTSFMIDGAPISTNANMQSTVGSTLKIGNSADVNGSRSTVNAGVDMRSISTDQIEKVEIIRGIPSVRYGDLTSGVIKITREKGYTPLRIRVKADGLSKLFAISKGVKLNSNSSLNLGVDYLHSKNDPTDNFASFNRVTSSLRYTYTKNYYKNNKVSKKIEYNSNLDYVHTLDDVKTDPDAGYKNIDTYKSSYNKFSFANNFSINFTQSKLFDKLELTTNISYDLDEINQTKYVQLSTPTFVPNSLESGIHDGIYLPANWTSKLKIDGKPLSIYTNLNTTLSIQTYSLQHHILLGTGWSFDKNYGEGQVYNVNEPPSIGMSTRPRTYKSIPSSQDLFAFAEDNMTLPIGKNMLSFKLGIRATSILNLDKAYEMHGKVYIDPRVNFKWNFPEFELFGEKSNISIGGGYGMQTKKPTLSQIYPDWIYYDIVQLNYYHNNPDYRRINLNTYKESIVNYNLTPAKNKKYEIRLGFNIGQNTFNIDYFDENMNDGFRTSTVDVKSMTYTKYDPLSIDASDINSKPELSDFSSVPDTLLKPINKTTNGSSIHKKGIEFTFSSKRFDNINTRVTINGAWFRTHYANESLKYQSASTAIAGTYVSTIGIYDSSAGYVYDKFNTNFMFDTYVPSLNLIFSTTFQCTWYSWKQTTPYSGTPISYISKDGNIHPYTDVEKNDPYLGILSKDLNESLFKKYTVPFGMDINFKMSKNIYNNKAKVSLFVNRILGLYPKYTRNDVVFKRVTVPYFGAEIIFKL